MEEELPRLRLLSTSLSSAVLRTARNQGFAWCYEYTKADVRSVLSALMLGILFHEHALRGTNTGVILRQMWEDLESIFVYSEGKWFEHFAQREIWTALDYMGVSYAQKICESANIPDFFCLLKQPLDLLMHGQLLHELSSALSLELHILRENAGNRVSSVSFNSGNESLRCFVVVGIDQDKVLFLGHERFLETQVRELEFPFTTSEVTLAPSLQFMTTETVSPVSVVQKLLDLVVSAKHRLTGLEEKYAVCQAAVETYSRATGQNLCLSPLPTRKEPSHAIRDCAQFDVSEQYVELKCTHRFHRKCYSEYLLSTLNQTVSPTCPLCASQVSAVPTSISPVLEQCTDPGLVECSVCHLERLSKHVFAHYTDRHNVCVCCLKSLRCPGCGCSLSEEESAQVRAMLNRG